MSVNGNPRTDWKIDPALLASPTLDLSALIAQAVDDLAGREKITRLALSKTEAAQSLGVSLSYFEAHIAPDLRMARKGRRCLIPVRELDKWLDSNATLTLEKGGRPDA